MRFLSVGLGGPICNFIERDQTGDFWNVGKEGRIEGRKPDEKVCTYLFLAGGSKIRESGAHLEGERRKNGLNSTGLMVKKYSKEKYSCRTVVLSIIL